MKKWIVKIAVLILVMGAGVYGVGYFLPEAHQANGDVLIDAPPEVVWETLTDVSAYGSWRSDVDSVMGVAGTTASRVWTEEPSGLSFSTVIYQPGILWRVRITNEGLPFGGAWSYRLAQEGAGTRLAITEDGEVYSPFYRFVSRFIMGHDRTLRRYLNDVEMELETPE